MALLICTDCTTRYSVGAPKCPECGSTEYVEEGAEDMAKIRVHGGVSDANAEPEPEEGEDASTGADASPASEEESNSPEQAESDSPQPARTTASRSKRARTE